MTDQITSQETGPGTGSGTGPSAATGPGLGKVLAYCRLSSVEQENMFGGAVQEAAIRQYCSDHGLPDPDIRHETMSGTKKCRPILDAIYREAEQIIQAGGRVHLVFKCLDRIGREMTVVESYIVRAFAMGLELHSCESAEQNYVRKDSAQDSMTKFFRRVIFAMAEFDKERLYERMNSGKKEKARSGGFAGGRPPLGYIIVEKELAVDQSKTQMLTKFFELVDLGLGDVEVAETMKREFPAVEIWVKDKSKPKYLVWGRKAVGRIKANRRLYEGGRFLDGNDQEHMRPDLVILNKTPVLA
jgi:DNA invertase Pin-like site-specific DNA recombinase